MNGSLEETGAVWPLVPPETVLVCSDPYQVVPTINHLDSVPIRSSYDDIVCGAVGESNHRRVLATHKLSAVLIQRHLRQTPNVERSRHHRSLRIMVS